jgi:hypothetical protein
MSDDNSNPIEVTSDSQNIEFGQPIAKMETAIKIDMTKGLAVAQMQPIVQPTPNTPTNSDSSSQTTSNNTSSSSEASSSSTTSEKE